MNNRPFTTLALLALLAPAAHAEVLRLGMEEAIAAALERNFSVSIERIEPRVAEEALRSAKGAFDPVWESEYGYRNEELPFYQDAEESAMLRFGVSSTLPWGTEIEAELNANDRTTPFDTFTGQAFDSVNTFAGIVLTQPLLRNFGLKGTYTRVRVARESVGVSWQGFRARVMDVVADVVTAYQNLFFAQENLRIAEQNRDLALQLLQDNRRRVETGAMAPLDIVQAESEAALREVSVISARAFQRQARNALKRLIWADPDSILQLELEIQPPQEPEEFLPDRVRDYTHAMASRPEYLASLSGLVIRDLELEELRRNALPRLDLVGSYGRRGLDTSLDESVDQAFNAGYEQYAIGAVFSLPFPNRTRSAERITASLRRNQAELGLRQLEQDIRLELDNAATQLNADWERIHAARTARQLSEKSLQAEEKKLQAGTSSTFVVLRLQGDLADAEIREINALTDYAVSLARYHRVRGRILEVHGIELNPEVPAR